MFAKYYAISEKLQHILYNNENLQFFYTSRGTSSLPSMNKIRVGMVFSLVHLTWDDPLILCRFDYNRTKKIGLFTCRHKNVIIFGSDMCRATIQRTNFCASMATLSLCITLCLQRLLYINNTKATHCCISVATWFTRTRHNITIYIHCLVGV
jgi:hypothetical protein